MGCLTAGKEPSCIEAPGASIVGAIAIPFEVAMAEFVIAIYAFVVFLAAL